MGSVAALLRLAMLAVSIILLTAVFGCAVGDIVKYDDLPERFLLEIRRLFAPRKETGVSKLRRLFQTFSRMDLYKAHELQLFGKEVSAAQWLANVNCAVLLDDRTYPHFNMMRLGEGVKCCLQVEFGWSHEMASILPTLLGARMLWANGPALFSMGRRSWSLLDADALAMLIHTRADPKSKYQPICVGFPSRVASTGSIEQWHDWRDDDELVALGTDASGFGIEQLHIALHDYELPLNVQKFEKYAKRLERGLRDVLPEATFSLLATSLLSASFLRDVSISWDDVRSNPTTVRDIKAIATALAESATVRKLAMMRTCSGRNRGLSLGPDPLAAFSDVANAERTWRTIETLSLTTHFCTDYSDAPSSELLNALPKLVEHMPALRRIHFEHRVMGMWMADSTLKVVLPLVQPNVTITIAANTIGFVGVARAKSLAELGESVPDGYAVVMSAPVNNLPVPISQMELVGKSVLLETTALTLLPTGIYEHWYELRMPKLERLAIDSRWTKMGSLGKFVATLPSQIGSKLKALMVHTLLLDNDRYGAFRVLEGILQAGRDTLAVVDLGIKLLGSVSDVHTDIIKSLAVTLRSMRNLKSLHFRLTGWSPISYSQPGSHMRHVRTLADLVGGVLPHANITVVSDLSPARPESGPERVSADMPFSWRRMLSVNVPATPHFPSPRQFFE